MTKYVLNSGGIKNQPELKKKFHQELVKSLGSAPRFLLCDFAQPREYWESKFQAYSNSIAEDMPRGVRPSFTLAMPNEFKKQCEQSDVIYLHGGDDHLLQYWMGQFNVTELFKNKVVATNSASSDVLVAHFWTCDWRQCADGLGLLPINFLPHYQSDFGANDPRGPVNWKNAYDDLAGYGDTSLPIHALKEGEYIVIEK